MRTWNDIEAEVEQLFADKPRVRQELFNLIAKLEACAIEHVQLGEVMGWFSDCPKEEVTINGGYLIAYATGAAGLLRTRYELHHEGKAVELQRDVIAQHFKGMQDLEHPELGLVPDYAKSTYIYFSAGPGVPALNT